MARENLPSAQLKILLVEDDPNARTRLAEAIRNQSDMQLLDAVPSLKDGRRVINNSRPDVLLVDLGLPDGDGTDLIREISSSKHTCEIMVVTVFGDEKHVLRAIEAGASGYLLKEEDSDQIGDCIRQLVQGGSPISAPIARHLLTRFRNQNNSSEPNQEVPKTEATSLTERETEVLRLIAKGYNSNEIASLLDVTYYTVTSHVRSIYRKLAVHSRSEAVFEAVQRGLVNLSS